MLDARCLLYARDARVRFAAAEEIIAARREAWQRSQASGQASKADVLRADFWGKRRLAADTADPRILALGGEALVGGSTSNDFIVHLLTEDRTGYMPPEEEGESHTNLMRRLLPKEQLCHFLGIDNLREFNPLVHGRAAFRFFVMQLTKENVRVAPLGQTSVEIMQFGPLTQKDLLEMFPDEELQRLGMNKDFLELFVPPTVEEMVADGIVLDGEHPQTLIKVASGHSDSYQVISELYGLGLAPNATIGVPTAAPFTDIHGHKWQQAGEMAIGAQLGAAAIAFYIGRAQKYFEGRFPLHFVGECISLTGREGIISMAASINTRQIADLAFRIGASVVTMQPEKMQDGMNGFLTWARQRAEEPDTCRSKNPLPQDRVIPFAEYQGRLQTTSSPLLKEGYAKFLKAHVTATWRVCQFISQL